VSERFILSLRYTPVTRLKTLRAGVGGFLRYIQYRDQPQREEQDLELSKLLKYVHHRDRTAPRGRLFDARGRSGDLERRSLERYIARSVKGLEPRRQRDGEGRPVDRQRAVYQIVLSPERAEGLDLQRLARTVMAELEREAGHDLPPWLAAEHRNTAHPHVHVVMAARRELEPGHFRSFVINRERLAGMKLVLGREIERQREPDRVREPGAAIADAKQRERRRPPERSRPAGRIRERDLDYSEARSPRQERERVRQRARHLGSGNPHISHVLRRLALAYQREAERAEREREREERPWS
jgi:hypothetical protein